MNRRKVFEWVIRQKIMYARGRTWVELVGMSFLDRGDTVVVEAPTYLGAIMAFRPELRHQLRQQSGRQVVDAVIASIFEHMQGDAFARAGKTCDE